MIDKIMTWITILLMAGCIYESNYEPEMYYNVELKIESINGQTAVTQDKFRNVVYCNTVVFSCDNMIYIYNTCGRDYKAREYLPNIDEYWIINHKVGDVIKLKQLPKNYLK